MRLTMRILYTNFHAGNGGGHVTYVLALARGLAADHDITIASPAGSPLLAYAAHVPNVRTAAIDFKPRARTFVGQLVRLRRLISKHRFDIIHVNGSADHRQVMLATCGMKRPPSIVFTKHNDYPVRSFGNCLRGWFATTHSIAVSDYVARLLADSPYRRATVVKHGVDTQRSYHPELGASAEQRRIALLGAEGARRIVLGSVGGTGSHKGWQDLIDALSLLPAHERERFSVLLAGDLPNAEQLDHVARQGLTGQVHFTGIIHDAEYVLGCSDVAFVLSHKETLSYACRESMAAGLPVLVSAAGGLTENVDDGVNGWVVPVRNPVAIARVLRRILETPEALPEMGRAAREKSVSEFGLDAFLMSTCAVYHLASRAAPVVQTTDTAVRAAVRLR